MGGIRARLAVTLVALVAVTVAAIGLGVYAFVDASLRSRALEDARQQVDYNLSVLVPGADPAPSDRRAFEASGLPTAFALRGSGQVLADFGDGAPFEPQTLPGALASVSPEVRVIVAGGEIGFAWQDLGGAPVLVVGGRQGGPPELYFVFPASPIETALAQLRIGLLAAGAAAVGFALVVAGLLARWILRPLEAAGRAARRIAAGDLAARVPAGGRDELGRWSAEFNRMADSLEGTVASLESAQGQNRRFVADVAHELRTPLTALVAEASLIEGHAGELSPDARRATELLVADVRRLRVLVDDLMEISRFDADAERPALEPVDLGRVVTGAGPRPPSRSRRYPWSWTPTRAGSIASSATSSTMRGTMRREPRWRSPSRRPVRAPSSWSPTAVRASRATPPRTSSTASTRPIRRGPVGAPGWASPLPRSTPRCWAARCAPVRGRAEAWCSPSRFP